MPGIRGVKKSNSINKSINDKIFRFFLYSLSGIILIMVIYPLYFVVIASFSDPSAVAGGHVWLWPQGWTLDGYKELFKHSDIWVGYKNTILYTLVGTVIGLIVNLGAAYSLSRKDLVGGRFITLIFIFTMFFNGGLIPTYMTIQAFHLYDTFLVMVLPFSVSVYNMLIAKSFFQYNIPSDLYDSARIDGCGNLYYFYKIVLPLSKSVISVIGLWTAVGLWNSYFNALIYIQDAAKDPLQLVLRNILITNDMGMSFGSGEAMQVALRLAGLMRYSVIIVSTIPIMCVYPFVQKHFNQGVMIGAVKG